MLCSIAIIYYVEWTVVDDDLYDNYSNFTLKLLQLSSFGETCVFVKGEIKKMQKIPFWKKI